MPASNVAIAGASGLVGSHVVRHLLARDDVGVVAALGRRPLAIAHERLVSTVADLQDAKLMAAALTAPVAIACCCLGTTIKRAGSQAAFRAVDHDAVVAFAQATRARGAEHFLVVTSLGADAASRNFYQRTKGEAEQSLMALGFRRLTILRPSLIDDRGARQESRLGERLMLPLARAVFALVGRTHRYAPIAADTIARAMVRLAFDDTKERVRIVESDRLHQVGG